MFTDLDPKKLATNVVPYLVVVAVLALMYTGRISEESAVLALAALGVPSPVQHLASLIAKKGDQ